MPARRVNPYRVKTHYSYTARELADCVGVHKNTVRNWRREGLEPVDKGRPVLFQGATVRAFLLERNEARKQPCPPGTLYCLRCRQPRAPALGMVDYLPMTSTSGNLRAICETCEAMMHQRVRKDRIAAVVPGCTDQMGEGQPSLSGKAHPSLNCDLDKEG
jgi:hypothetical protein